MRKNYIKYIFALLLFGSNGLVASYISLTSYETVFLRTMIGSIFLLLIYCITQKRFQLPQNKKHTLYLMISGAAMGASWMFLYEGYHQIGVSLATLTYYFGPVIVMAAAPFLFREKLTATKITGIIAALLGIFLINGNDLLQGGFSWGLICGILSAVMYAVMVVFNKLSASITGLENAVWQLSSSFVTVAIFTFLKQGFCIPVAAGDLLPVLFLGVVNTGIGCYLYFSSIGHLTAQSVALCGYLEPLSALFFSAAFLQERLALIQFAGAFLILGGAAFGEYYGRKQSGLKSQVHKNDPSI
ncbi:DMT family transporter [Candidatus Soleaferrea massiliensis]|uniref:DMT family transporter n=1 Tax=Candidatus Soleaferrea massiliensis TaxID=1470354 RepID=UPI000590BDEB|nr:DMT family transporter [Candidatus Soleaferrea massiliensis]